MIQITPTEDGKPEICETVLRALPLWFGIESSIQEYINDVKSRPMLVAKDADNIVGFVSLTPHNIYTAEIHVMGVLPEYHRQKVGQQLLDAVENYLRQKNFKYLSVKTLSPSRPNKEYDQTRAFYLKMGFLPVEEFKTLWGEANPCLLLIKNI